MNIGKLRHRLELQSATDSTDSYGQPARTWATYATVWGEVVPVSGVEAQTAYQAGVVLTHLVTVRYRDDVTAQHRIKYGTRYLNIKAVRNQEERGIALEMDAEEDA